MTDLLTRPDLVPSPVTAPRGVASGARLSAAAIDAVSAALLSQGVSHGRLVEGSPTLNHTLSDGSRVFCKVSRPGEVSPRPGFELTGTRMAAAAGIASNVALLDAPLEIVDEHGQVRVVTAWRFEQSCTPPALIDQARLVAEAACAAPLAGVDASAAHQFDLSFFLGRIEGRLASLAAQGQVEADAVLGRAREVYSRTAALMDPAAFQWTHSDAHLKNVIWRVDGRPMLIDWESNCRGPIEWDIAAVIRSCFQDFPEHDLGTQYRAARAAILTFRDRIEFNPDLALLSVSARGLSYQSHLLAVGHDPVMLERTRRLDELIDSGFVARLFSSL